jgi:hypothetical protein
MTWNSEHYKNNWSELEDFYRSENNMSKINWHSLLTYLSWALIFVIGGLNLLATHGVNVAGYIAVLTSILGTINHSVAGNTATSS